MSEIVTFAEAERLMKEAFLKRLYRPTVVAVIQDAAGRLLVVQSVKDASIWMFPQGAIEEGEEIVGAFFRELEEEAGIRDGQLLVKRLLGVEDIDAPPDRDDKSSFSGGNRYAAVLARYLDKRPLALKEDKLSAYAWLPPPALKTRIDCIRREKRDYMLRLLSAAGRK